MARIVKVQSNVIRYSPLNGPKEWADGDYTAIMDDGSTRNATLYEHLRFIGLPDDYCQRTAERAKKID